ncbi:MAG: UMP kinase, partial [Candidatus Cloacimonetes bacterium]|nr:UMP kinase [Candidatus Cloacimonadota bacterium]
MKKYQPEKISRVILKLSGEILSGSLGFGYDEQTIEALVDDIIAVKQHGVSLGIVLGGGNIFRGLRDGNDSINRTVGDNVGM